MRKFVYLVLFAVVWMKVITGVTGCANIIPPTGGPRDSLPPRLISATPKDSTLRFTGERIVFTFDEYIDLQAISENLIVSPTLKNIVGVTAKLRTITVKIKDTLEANTTYSLNFGNSVRDVNENNILKNFTYVFSTGTFLDNRKFSGSVIVAETGKVDSTLTVMLHRSGVDSAVVKERPRYYARLDGAGHFTFRNLPAGQFYLYAVKSESGTPRYDSPEQLFAFADKPVVIADSTPFQTLFAYAEPPEVKKSTAGRTQTTAAKASTDKRLTFSTNLDGTRQDLLDSFKLIFPNPLKVFDSAAILLTDINFQPIKVRFLPDSLHQKFALKLQWKPDSTYNLVLKKEFAEDSSGRKLLKSDTITFKAKKESDYGNLKLRFPALDLSRHPVLQFVQSDIVKQSTPFTTKEFNKRLFPPGEYTLRILYDVNQNGKWDYGSFFGTRRQPEVVVLIKKPIKVKGNWENDEVVEVPK
ncbi:MAG: Ig-like domain-containing protein [Chitinophagaceae bacterium]